MSHYKSNLRDIEFNLFEVFGRGEVYGAGEFADMDVDTARSILAEVERLAVEDLAPSLVDSDRNPPIYHPETFSATLPECFKRSYKAFMDAEWWRLGLPVSSAARPRRAPCAGRSPSWCWAPTRRSGCTPPAPTSPRSCGASAPRSSASVARQMVEGQWGSTMVLTEPDAGSDVGAGRTKAVAAARRHLAHRRREAVHHLRRARHVREHRPPGARPPRGRRRRAPRACRCSSCPSSTSTGRPASSASATAPTSPTSSTRWASRPPRPAS